MTTKEVCEAWKNFKFPVYKVGDLLYSEKSHKIYEVKQTYYIQPDDKYEYIIAEAGKGYREDTHVNVAELLFRRMRKATKTEILLYG